MVLAVFMAMGFELHRAAAERAAVAGGLRVPALEAVLFGGVFQVGWSDVWTAGVACVIVLGVLAVLRRPLAFWSFDETVCPVHGVSPTRMSVVTTLLIAIATIVAVDRAGVVLATAMLVLPGATALALGGRLVLVVATSALIAILGTAAGLVVSFEANTLPGPAVVGVFALMFAAASLGPWRARANA